jgi:hypothetical protein
MIQTVLDLIDDAATVANIKQAGESLAPEEAALGLRFLNRMFDAWVAEKLAPLGLFRRSCTLTGAASYTIGYAAPAVVGTVDGSGGFTITSGTRVIKLSVDGETAITINLTTGSRSLAQVVAEINVALSTAGGNTALALSLIAGGIHVEILGGTSGAASSIQILTVTNNAYTVLGFTVGSTTTTSSFSADRPVKIKSAETVTALGVSRPVAIVPAETWAAVADKTRVGLLIETAFCDYGQPVSTIYVSPMPSDGTFLLTNYETVTAFASLGDAVNLAPGFAEAVISGLAFRLAVAFGKPSAAVLAAVANAAKVTVAALVQEIVGPVTAQPAAAQPAGQ